MSFSVGFSKMIFLTISLGRGRGDLCAAGVGAPQIRQRLFWVADTHDTRRQGAIRQGQPLETGATWAPAYGESLRSDRRPWPPGPGEIDRIPVLANGLPGVVGGCKGYGNAIVPQVAAEFIGAYLDVRAA
jgi:DNA (cytosine-5)-methyltransferase 1